MTTPPQQPQQPPQATANDPLEPVREACARNVPLELHRRTNRGALPTARGRMIDLDADRIYMETPQVIGRPFRIAPGQEYEAFFQVHDTIFTFSTTVLETDCATRLNHHKFVVGLAISKPEALKIGQRREHFRTSLACEQEISCTLHEAGPGDANQVPIEAKRFTGRLVDASGGGVGVILDGTIARFTLYDHLFLEFFLPGERQPFCALVEVRQARPTLNDTAVRLGLMFVAWPDQPTFTRTLMPLHHYLNKVQRLLRRSA